MRYLILTTSAILLTACGFTPMHAGQSGAAFENLSVSLAGGEDLGDEQAGFYVMQRLRDRIEIAAAPQQTLDITMKAQRRSIGITDGDVASRYDTALSATYVLTDIKSGKVLEKGTVNSTTTFGAPFDPYGVVAADSSSKQQAAKEIADRMLNTLARYYANAPTTP